MKSMTGFGRGQSSSKEATIDLTIRSVNSRFLETRLNLPPEYQELESDLKSAVQKKIRRGRVDIQIWRKQGPKSEASALEVNEELASAYVDAYEKVGKFLKMKGSLTLDWVVRQPGVIRVAQNSGISEVEKKQIFETLEEALKKCNEERAREGKVLQKNLRDLLEGLSDLSGHMESQRKEANEILKERFRTRLDNLGFTGEALDQRLWQEVSLQVEKSDIDEELVRFREHVAECQKVLESGKADGKKLDFYVQELLRETNTVGSKSQVADLTKKVVEAKSVIEKIREQVQNIE